MANNQNDQNAQARPGTLSELYENVQLAWNLLRDSRVPVYLRFGIPLLVAAYIIFPIDFIPDLLPGLGQIDDLAALWLGLIFFLQLSPENVVEEYRRKMHNQTDAPTTDGDFVDGDFRVVD